MDTTPLVENINDKDCDESRCMAVIENNSELTYHDDGNMCVISDSMIAKMMKKLTKKNKKGDDLLNAIDESDEFDDAEEVKPKKMNRNSRALKKEREERKIQAQKAKEEKERKEREQIKELSQKSISKFNYERPTKKKNSTLQNLAKKKISQNKKYIVC